MVVTATAGKTDAVEIFQDLNGKLSPHVQTIAEISRTGGASRLIQFADQAGKRDDTIVAVITIFHDRNDEPLLRGMAQYLAHHLLVGIRFTGEIANPPGLIAKQRGRFLQDCLLLCGEPGFVIRQMQPAVVAFDHAALTHVFYQQQHQRIVFHWQRHTTQALAPRARFILMLFMVGGKRV